MSFVQDWETSSAVSFVPTPTQSEVQTALRNFLLAILPAGIEVVAGQVNRVADHAGAHLVVFTAIRTVRIETNHDCYVDCQFTASIAGTLMTVTGVQWGIIPVGNQILTGNVAAGTTITAQDSGPSGGAGTYTVAPSQTVSPAVTMATGAGNAVQATEVTFQIDVHGPNSADNAETISTLFRDDYTVRAFESYGYDVTPLHADDPKQVPFLNAEEQFETRWIVEACLQVNQVVSPPQQFATQLKIPLVVADPLPVN